MARLGIFGGSFDPPHIGHLILAETAREEMRLDSVQWVLTPDPPHKDRPDLTCYPLRRRMVEAAISGNAGFAINDVEQERPGPHYIVDTVRILQQRYSGDQTWLVVGEDSLRDLPRWHHPAELLAAIPLLVLRRPYAAADLAALERALPGITARTRFLDAPTVDVSSTAIRVRLREGRSCRYLLPEMVERIIRDEELYRQITQE
jgi:nicotinate-nucleotide adenylyltransferase